ncbi:MAG: ClbS/DfsB family four-helix bundle protein [Chloroflexi bacterium]|nr:ClbS/DfsB family four-helix bundle protein [Chloroflexota bacterium]
MMNDKQQLLEMLKGEFNRWEDLLANLSEEQITAPQLRDNWSIKDMIAHLWAWQQRSIARLEAARLNRDPEFPKWPAQLDPQSEDDTPHINASLYAAYREQPWASVHRDWQAGFRRFLELGEAMPEPALLEPGRYTWLGGAPLAVVLRSSYEHHDEHFGYVLAGLWQHRTMKIV